MLSFFSVVLSNQFICACCTEVFKDSWVNFTHICLLYLCSGMNFVVFLYSCLISWLIMIMPLNMCFFCAIWLHTFYRLPFPSSHCLTSTVLWNSVFFLFIYASMSSLTSVFNPRITLEIMTLQPKCEDVETAEGVAITVTGVAQVSIYSQSSYNFCFFYEMHIYISVIWMSKNAWIWHCDCVKPSISVASKLYSFQYSFHTHFL